MRGTVFLRNQNAFVERNCLIHVHVYPYTVNCRNETLNEYALKAPLPCLDLFTFCMHFSKIKFQTWQSLLFSPKRLLGTKQVSLSIQYFISNNLQHQANAP